MTSPTNEMDVAFAAPASDMQAVPELPPEATGMDDVTISNPVPSNEMTPDMVYVYANNITPVNTEPGNAIVSFDVVFSVSCTDPVTGSTSTHQVVKRIGVDKMKMANDAKMTTPISIVEAQAPLINATKERFKALAGLK